MRRVDEYIYVADNVNYKIWWPQWPNRLGRLVASHHQSIATISTVRKFCSLLPGALPTPHHHCRMFFLLQPKTTKVRNPMSTLASSHSHTSQPVVTTEIGHSLMMALIMILFLTMAFVALFICTNVPFDYMDNWRRLRKLHRLLAKPSFELPDPVSRLSDLDGGCIAVLMSLKHILGFLGLLPKLQPDPDGIHILLPKITATAKLYIARDQNEKYDAATKGIGEDTSTLRNRLMLLPALVNPMLSMVLANRNCPLLPFKCTNIRTIFDIRDAESCRDPRNLDYGSIVVLALFGGPEQRGRRVEGGIEFDMRIVVIKMGNWGGGDSVWEQVVTVLADMPASSIPAVKISETTTIDEPAATWSIAVKGNINFKRSAPTLWAAIHLHMSTIHGSAWKQRVLGLSNSLTHGNHALAVAIQQLRSLSGFEPPIEEEVNNLLWRHEQFVLNVIFKRPIDVPIDLKVEYGRVCDGKFALRVVGKEGEEYLCAYKTLR